MVFGVDCSSLVNVDMGAVAITAHAQLNLSNGSITVCSQVSCGTVSSCLILANTSSAVFTVM